MQIVDVPLKRSHYGATVEEVHEAFNEGRGTSTLIGMAVDPVHRPKVQEYRDIVRWKLEHTEGEALAKWREVARHLDVVLAGSQMMHERNLKAARLTESPRGGVARQN